jgi:hypothetical protein
MTRCVVLPTWGLVGTEASLYSDNIPRYGHTLTNQARG